MIQCNELRISLDRREPNADIDFVSHAHSDHVAAVKSSKAILASAETIQLIEQTQNITIRNKVDNARFKLIEAGHMLGSRQLCIDDNASSSRTVFTGDFQMERSKTSRPIEIVETDTLIMDSTYAEPSVRFDEKYEVETALQDWTSRMKEQGIVIFSAYALGKAQELISILNDVGIRPVVSKKISNASRVYVQNGISLDYSSAFDSDPEYGSLIRDNFVGITDSRDLAAMKRVLGFAYQRNVYTAMATGFAKIFRFDTDAQFPLSDHADFSQSVDYIEATHAKNVLTYGPSAELFARNLREEGYGAIPFKSSALALNAPNSKR